MTRLTKLNLVLAGLLVVQGVVYMAAPDRTASFTKVYESIYTNVRGKDVWKIEISSSKEGKKVVLKKNDKGWELPDSYGYPADTSKVEEILSLLQTFRRAKIVGENESMYPSYGVTDRKPESRLRMFDKDGKVLVDLLVGKGTVRSTFVRKAKDRTVYELSTSLSAKLFTDASYYFRETSLKFPAPKERKRIILEYDGQKLVFEKKTIKGPNGKDKDQWDLVSPTALEVLGNTQDGTPQPEFDRMKIDMFASSLNGVTFSDVAGKVGSGSFGFDKPHIVLTVEDTSGKKHVLKVGAKVKAGKNSTEKEGSLVKGDRYAVMDDGPYVVILKSYVYRDWEKKFTDFLKKKDKDSKDKAAKNTGIKDDSEAKKPASTKKPSTPKAKPAKKPARPAKSAKPAK